MKTAAYVLRNATKVAPWQTPNKSVDRFHVPVTKVVTAEMATKLLPPELTFINCNRAIMTVERKKPLLDFAELSRWD